MENDVDHEAWFSALALSLLAVAGVGMLNAPPAGLLQMAAKRRLTAADGLAGSSKEWAGCMYLLRNRRGL
jgi:hypothetical protein